MIKINMKEALNIPNSFSFLRIILAAPISFLLIENKIAIALIVIIIAAITDVLDGWLARKMNQVTEFGKIIDPLADKVIFAMLAITLIYLGKLPLWFVVIILGRDLLILIGAVLASKRVKSVIPSDKVGKNTVILLGFALIFIIAGLQPYADYLMYISAVVLVYSFIHYIQRGIEIMRNNK